MGLKDFHAPLGRLWACDQISLLLQVGIEPPETTGIRGPDASPADIDFNRAQLAAEFYVGAPLDDFVVLIRKKSLTKFADVFSGCCRCGYGINGKLHGSHPQARVLREMGLALVLHRRS
jgi:hypothetical protein